VSVPRCLVWVAALASVLAARPASAQRQFSRPVDASGFELSISEEFEASKPILVVHASIPYRRLVFFLRGSGYEAKFRVYLELKDAHGKRVQGEVWEESATTADFKETSSRSKAANVRKRFAVAPGEYRAEVVIEVIGTSRRFSQQETVRIVGGGVRGLEISQPTFYTESPGSQSVKPPAGQIAFSWCSPGEADSKVNPGAVYGDTTSWVKVAFNVAAGSSHGSGRFAITARVRDSEGTVVLYNHHLFNAVDQARATLCMEIDIDSFVLGRYEIGVIAETGDGEEKSESQGRFTVLFNRGLLGEHFGDLLEILSAIASKKELEPIENAAPGDRMKAWASFWRKRDESSPPGSSEQYGEFLARLKEVLASFSRVKPGWKTDMGKTYLLNGEPDKIDNRQDPRMGRYYELWYYYSKGTVYVFEDTVGSGEYRLITTEMI
jgi:GWxTD domain-containing protein